MQKRSIVKAIIYSFLTCGLYGCYWFIRLTDEAHEAAGRQTTASTCFTGCTRWAKP